MAAELTTEDVLKLYELAIHKTATCLGISLSGKSVSQLFDEISSRDKAIFNLLETFIVSYRQYQNFHIGLDLRVFNGNEITEWDRSLLADHMNNRDNSRNALIQELKNRGC